MRINSFTPNEEVFAQSFGVDKSKETKGNGGFSEILKSGLDKVNEKALQSENATEMLVKGEDIEIHEVMLAAEEAKIALNFAVEVRNKLVEAYQEINRIQL